MVYTMTREEKEEWASYFAISLQVIPTLRLLTGFSLFVNAAV
jgi:hypothetical protein